MNRREFVTWVGVGGAVTALPALVTACSQDTITTQPTATTPPSARNDGFEEVGTVSQLNQDGKIYNKNFAQGSLLVVRDTTNPEQLFAVNPICPHAGCTVTWKGDKNYFSCPCHDSTFAPDGKVLSGIAKEPLPQYEAKIEGDLILVKNI